MLKVPLQCKKVLQQIRSVVSFEPLDRRVSGDLRDKKTESHRFLEDQPLNQRMT